MSSRRRLPAHFRVRWVGEIVDDGVDTAPMEAAFLSYGIHDRRLGCGLGVEGLTWKNVIVRGVARIAIAHSNGVNDATRLLLSCNLLLRGRRKKWALVLWTGLLLLRCRMSRHCSHCASWGSRCCLVGLSWLLRYLRVLLARST